MPNTLSVIITAYNKNDITKIHVRECMNADLMPDEIIVVNDSGTPDLKDKLKELSKKTKIIYAEILPPKILWNYNGACNLGVWLSRGDYLAIEDNDNIPHKDFYGEAIKMLEENPHLGRIIAKARQEVSVKDIEKPVEQWNLLGSRGANQGTYILRRDIYLKLKGQDERFCGRYGWMYYDWKRRMLTQTLFSSTGTYYYVLEGQCDLPHKNDQQNYHIYHSSARERLIQSPAGILNFKFNYEVL